MSVSPRKQLEFRRCDMYYLENFATAVTSCANSLSPYGLKTPQVTYNTI
ncbi:hypothetical protein [Sulfodiicoccus acidiphilus]|nr:hypothetical protein [Sulfodiicoccus acidiphilus]